MGVDPLSPVEHGDFHEGIVGPVKFHQSVYAPDAQRVAPVLVNGAHIVAFDRFRVVGVVMVNCEPGTVSAV